MANNEHSKLIGDNMSRVESFKEIKVASEFMNNTSVNIDSLREALQRLLQENRGVPGTISGIVRAEPEQASMDNPNDKKQEEEPLYAQTPINPSDYVFSATSKIARQQDKIAINGSAGVMVNVGSETNPVNVAVSISDKAGNPLVLLEGAKQLQDVIAGMIQENGLPLYVTAAQIFRRYAGRTADSAVTAQECDDIDAAMQYLMQTHVYLNFSQQVEKHTSLKKRDELAKRAEVDGPLILAYRVKMTASNGGRVTGYHIAAMPILSRYSRDVAQVMRYPRQLLQAAPQKKTTTSKGSNVMREMIIKRYLLDEINAAAKVANKQRRKIDTVKYNIELDNVFTRCGIEDTPKLRRTVRELIEKILDEWRTDKTSILRKWEAVYSKRKITGYVLTINPDKAEWRM